MYTRVQQVGLKYGASFDSQTGHYIPATEKTIKSEKRYREPSVQVILYPADDESWATFKKNIKEVADELLKRLAQQSIIAEYVKKGKIEETGQYIWRKKKRK